MPARDVSAVSRNIVSPNQKLKIDQATTEKVAKALNLQVAKLPQGVKDIIAAQTESLISENVSSIARTIASQEVKGALGQTNIQDRIDARFGLAATSLAELTKHKQVQQALKENAKLLKMKFDALVEVGFKDDQAFQVILTELARPRV